jgi:hypothetical protein
MWKGPFDFQTLSYLTLNMECKKFEGLRFVLSILYDLLRRLKYFVKSWTKMQDLAFDGLSI